MTSRAIIPDDEAQRLEAVRRYDVLDSPPDGAFDRVTRLASALLDMPIAIVSVVDEDRIWFKARHGLDVEEVGRDAGLCASAILQAETWVVSDAAVDPRALANPLVAGDFGLRFYAGAPLITADGYRLGTVCVIDRKSRELPPHGEALLADLAAIVVDELELRLAARKLRERYAERDQQAAELNDDVVQGLAVAKLSLELGEHEQALHSVGSALDASKRILDSLVEDARTLRRSEKARV